MHKIVNLTNSPYDIKVEGGGVERLPARGELENISIDPMHLPLYRALGYFVITAVDAKPKKAPKAPKPATPADPALAKLRAEYTELTGKRPYMGWKADKLQAAIDKALEA
ncbi:hypothetical protein NKH73_14155 [Mesorhizobium sp. M0938]|uniref:hypothetical protein n=1 Tax=unclassified Mesorhizobium TaxID=325217 RepID=UPI00333980D9